jgi:hypothetical protein
MPSPLVRDCRYLGRELLTWLWFLCEVEGGSFDLPIGTVELAIEDDLVLVGHDDEDSATRVKGGLPPLRPEAASALAAGMTARQARLLLARGEREWSFKLDAETLDLRAVKLPASETEDPFESLTERLESAHELRQIVDQLYARFIELRLSDQWDGLEAPRMRSWIRFKLDQSRHEQDQGVTSTRDEA